MKLIIINPNFTNRASDGISMQAIMWKSMLEGLNHEVVLFNCWEPVDWASFDYILFIGYGGLFTKLVNLLAPYNNLISAPILDWPQSIFKLKLKSKLYNSHFKNPEAELFKFKDTFKFFLVRSNVEKNLLCDGVGVSSEKVFISRLPMRFKANDVYDKPKEKFCFHVSRLNAPEKNVSRLIAAGKKYGFNLVLAGGAGGPKSTEELQNSIKDYPNIKYVGWITDEELKDYYSRAKVFALPSFVEGVGLVALEAAAFGCDIVLTELGAPKEYFDQKAFLVDPYSIDDIGKKVIMALEATDRQPYLKEYILKNYNIDTVACSFENMFIHMS